MNALVHAIENLVTIQIASLVLLVLCFILWLLIYCWKGDV